MKMMINLASFVILIQKMYIQQISMIRTLSPKKHSICPPVILYVGPKLRNIGLVRSVLKNKSINIEYEKKIKKV